MSERHPIDELFHRALHDAEVTPPPAVWEGIVRERSKRRGGYWGWLAAGLLLLGGTAAFLIHNEQNAAQPMAEVQGSADANKNTSAVTERTPISDPARSVSSKVDEGPSATSPAAAQEQALTIKENSSLTTERTTDSATTQNNATPTTASLSNAAPKAASTAGAVGNVTSTSAPDRTNTAQAPSITVATNSKPVEEVIMRDAPSTDISILSPIRPVILREAALQDSMKRGRPAEPYVLPNADRWLALEVGRHNVKRTWYGGEPLLVDALNEVEVPHYTWSLGLLAGRSWRSGFGLSAGAAYEGSEYAFDHVDDRVRIDSLLIVPYLITLDTQVFVSNVDTVTFMTEENKQVSGTNRFSVVHVPVEGYWHKQHRRWTFGARAGLAAEFVTMRQGYTLDVDDEGAVMSVDLGAQAYDMRYHTTLTGMLGADVGFALTEHWGLWATPTYMHGITAWGREGMPYMLPERLSLRVRLSYTFTRIP